MVIFAISCTKYCKLKIGFNDRGQILVTHNGTHLRRFVNIALEVLVITLVHQ